MNDSFINCTVAETQYRIVLNVSLRDFTSAIGTNLVQIEVNVHSPAEFIQAVWNKSVNHIFVRGWMKVTLLLTILVITYSCMI